MKTTIATKVYQTRDYDLFEPHTYNRDVENIKELEASMRKYGFLPDYQIYTIKNGSNKLKIIDGHHRFETARKLRLPIYFSIGKKEVPIWALNAGTTEWKTKDYLNCFVRVGNPDYIEVKNYSEKTGMSIAMSLAVLTEKDGLHRNEMAKFRKGEYTVSQNRGMANKIASIVKQCKSFGIDFSTNSHFIRALIRVLRVERFCINHFLSKVKTHKSLMERQTDVAKYVELIERIYNRNVPISQKLNISFLAEQASVEQKNR